MSEGSMVLPSISIGRRDDRIDFVSSFLRYYRMPRIAGIHSVLVLVVYMTVAALSVEGSVLCFGEDGHVAMEFVDACNGSGFGAQLAGMESDTCGPCKDVQFLSNPAYTRNVSHYTQALHLMSPSPMSPFLPSKEFSDKYINLPEYSRYKTHACLHSVVLLI
jgi:hypothetical protein